MNYLAMVLNANMSKIYDPGQNTVNAGRIWSNVKENVVAFQDEIHIISNIIIASIAILLAIQFIGDAIYLASSTSFLGSTHDRSWASKGMLRTIVFLMLDGGAWVIANLVVMIATVPN